MVRKDWIIEFSQHLIDRNLNITWQLPSGTRSEALDEEVLPYLHKSGCRNLSYAPESGSPRVLKRIKKKVEPKRMIKSMRTARTHLRQGVAAGLLTHILAIAKRRGYSRISLETGTPEAFAPARRLYEKFGFQPCAPFADYKAGPFSVCMTKTL